MASTSKTKKSKLDEQKKSSTLTKKKTEKKPVINKEKTMNIEKVSKWVLIGLMSVSIIIFLFFFTIGYDRPWEDNPQMNDPQLLDVLCYWTFALVAACSVFMIGSFILYIIQHGLDKSIIYLWGLPIVSIVVGLIIGIGNKAETLMINGKAWNDPTDIILTDISIWGIAILSVIAIAVTIWSMIAEMLAKK